MKTLAARFCILLTAGIALSSTAWAQWPSDPALNLDLADGIGDQVQPKLLPSHNGGWYLSWFDNPAHGYGVYVQALDPGGVALAPHNGLRVANLGLSSTEDYGLSVDTAGNELVAFLDDREGSKSEEGQTQGRRPAGAAAAALRQEDEREQVRSASNVA